MNIDQFAPRELCEKLEKMGCESQSFFYYDEHGCLYFSKNRLNSDVLSVFVQNDFTGATEQADENCKKIWGTENKIWDCVFPFDVFNRDGEITDACWLEDENWRIRRTKMIWKKEKWFQYLERTMRK